MDNSVGIAGGVEEAQGVSDDGQTLDLQWQTTRSLDGALYSCAPETCKCLKPVSPQ